MGVSEVDTDSTDKNKTASLVRIRFLFVFFRLPLGTGRFTVFVLVALLHSGPPVRAWLHPTATCWLCYVDA